MSNIVLCTLNAKFIHAAFGLRYLFANLGELQSRAEIAEFDINQKPLDIAEALLARQPRILGLGVYIWNVVPTTELVPMLKRARPGLVIILGGPEVSHECNAQEIIRLADHVDDTLYADDFILPDTVNGVAIHAPRGLRRYFGLGQRLHEFAPMVRAFRGLFVAAVVTLDFHEAGWLAHWS